MSLKNILYISAGMRVLIVFLAIGLVFFRCLQSDNIDPLVEVPMIEAAATGQVDVVKRLLHKGQSANIVDRDGFSPLAFAVFNGIYPGSQKAIEVLLNNQADVRSRDKNGQAVIQNVIKIDYKDLRMQVMGKLIKFGAVIDDIDNKGFDVLQKNVETYDRTTTEMMLDWWGRLISPRMLQRAKARAKEYDLRDILEILNVGVKPVVRDAHWDPSIIDRRTGLNDLHCAVINNDKNLVEAILKRRADINKACEDEYGMRPLHLAVVHYQPDMVELLLGHKANVNAPNLFNNRPLHMVAWLNNPDIAKKIADILLKNGALINAQNNDGNTLLHILIYNNNRSLINYLSEHYTFDMHLKNKDRETPNQLAERLNRKDILDVARNKK
jgi:ankyrin repeat protein